MNKTKLNIFDLVYSIQQYHYLQLKKNMSYSNESRFSYNSSLAINPNAHNKGVYFYNRTDFSEILLKLSPLRLKAEKLTPYLHYLGLVANLLCVLILTQKKMINRKSIFYLVFLAFSDFMYNFLAELPSFLKRVKLVDYDIFKVSDMSCFFYDYRTATFHFFSVLLTLFVTVDRFNHIYNPLNLNRFANLTSKIFVGLAIFFLSLVIALPRGFLMVYNEIEKDCDARNFFRRRFGTTTLTYYQIYFTFTEPVVMWFIPGLLILCLNFYVLFKIFKSNGIGRKELRRDKMRMKSFKSPESLIKSIRRMSNRTKLTAKKSSNINEFLLEDKHAYRSSFEAEEDSYHHYHGKECNKNITKPDQETIFSSRYNNGCFSSIFKFKKKTSYPNEIMELGEMASKSINNDESKYIKPFNYRKYSEGYNAIEKSFVERKLMLSSNPSINFSAKNNIIQFGSRSTLNQNHINLVDDKRRNSIFIPSPSKSTSMISIIKTANTTTIKVTNIKNSILSVNQISHYITIITVGFYFILSTIPYGIMLSFQNNLTLKLNYQLNSKEDYFNDPLWIRYGHFREMVIVGKLFFISNHCFNFILYFLFNRLFRLTFYHLLADLKNILLNFYSNIKFKLFSKNLGQKF